MIKRFLVLAAFAVAPVNASAATLTATFIDDFSPPSFDGASAGQVAFEIEFNDTLGTSAGVLEGSEFVSFNWINNPFTFGSSDFRELLANAPTVSGIIEGFRTADFPGTLNVANWVFAQAIGSGTLSTAASSVFSYSITGSNTSVVPVPAALPLLLGGLGGLSLLGWRRKQQTA